MRFVDTNVFVYYLAGDVRYGAAAVKSMKRVEAGEEAIAPLLVIGQVCAYLEAKKQASVIPRFLGLLRALPALTKAETLLSDFRESEALQEWLNVDWRRWDDLALAAQMARLQAHEIYSNDGDFDRIPGVRRVFS